MDRITESLVDSFSKDHAIIHDDKTVLFEYFANYCIVKNLYGSDDFDLDDITTGKSTQGIDGIAIIVNQKLVTSTFDIDMLISINHQLSVKFILIQTKTSDSFNNHEIGNMMTFSRVFFGDDTSVFSTSEMNRFIELKNYIFDHADKLKSNPELLLYYVTTGTWNENDSILAPVSVGKRDLKKTCLFSNIEFRPIGSSEIQTLYRKTKESLKATFKFEKKITMYTISDNEVGYSGVLPFSEYKKLIVDENNQIKPVFEDNIRDYLGSDQDVNSSIGQSIKTGDPNVFCMLNNGVTIVTNKIVVTGDKTTIEDYQIVNGCQTSNVLLATMDDADNINNLMIPVRIIATQNEKLKDDITRATNSQTSIKKEQLEALSTFQKNLEAYYKSFGGDDVLVYERRTGQYRNGSVNKSRIVTIPIQIRTMAAMFLDEPSAVSGQYGTVVKRLGDKIFRADDKLIMYYVSALALYRLENLFRTGQIDKKYRRSRYHAMMLFKKLIFDGENPRPNSKKMEQFCNKMLVILNDSDKCTTLLKGIVEYIALLSDLKIEDRKCFERKETTDLLLGKFDELKKHVEMNIKNESV